MTQEGRKAPDFKLADENGKSISLKELKGKKVILYFYPRDNTPGCTREACDFRDHFSKFQTRGALIFGVSPDSVDSHRKFKDKYDLPFSLLSDPDHAVAEKYGAWGEKNMYGKKSFGIIRSTYVINEQGLIEKSYSKVKVDGHTDQVLHSL